MFGVTKVYFLYCYFFWSLWCTSWRQEGLN